MPADPTTSVAVTDGLPSTGACLPTYFMFQVCVDGHLVGE